MTVTRRLVLVTGLVAILAIAVSAVTMTSRLTSAFGEGDQPIAGSALDKASAAALDYAGGGRVSETEVGDEDSYYEVEVTLDDGSVVEVNLDQNFNVIGQENDDDGPNDQDGPNDD